MNITKIAHDNKALTFTLLVCVMFMGLTAYKSMPRNSMPPFLVRFVSIVTQFPGGSPERVEDLVSSRIEEVVQEIPEVDFITSESRTGISIVSVSIKESEFDLQPIFDRIRRKVDGVRDELPEGIIGPNVNDEVGDVFGILIGITAPEFTYAELEEIADDVRDELIKLADAAKVEIVGTQEERVFIDYDNARLAEMGLTQNRLQNILAGTNIISPGGNVILGQERIILEPSGNYESIEDLKNTLLIPGSGNQPIFLGDITRIYRGYIDPAKSIVSVNGKRGLVLGISLKEGGNIIDLGQQVDRTLRELTGVYPHGVDFSRVASQDIVVDISVADFIENLFQSVAVVLFVMLLFLGFRTGLVVASLIPMAIVVGLLLMNLSGVGLDKVSLAALILALGMLVDNAIVVSESIMVKMEGGEKPLDAALKASGELIVPLLVSTLTTSAAFLPFFLAESTMGEVVGPIFVVVSEVLISSWLISLTIIPLFCIAMVRVKQKKTEGETKGGFAAFYKRLLVSCLRYPLVVCGALVFLFFASLYAMTHWVPAIFMPDDDRNLVFADIEMPLGTAIERTTEVAEEIDQFLKEQLLVETPPGQGVTDWSSYVGEGAPKYDLGYSPSEGASHSAHFIMNTTSGDDNLLVIDKFERFCLERYPEMKLTVSQLASGGGSADPIAVRISGKDPERLYELVDGVKAKLLAIPGTKSIKDNWGMRTKKLYVDIDQARAQLVGISNFDIAVSLRTVLSGVEISQFREGDKAIPIVMRNAQAERMDIEALETLDIFSQSTGRSVPLKQVADISVEWQASKIIRRDLYKTITVTADVQTGVTASSVNNAVSEWLGEQSVSWPNGYTYALGGESEDSAEAMNAVMVNLPIAGFAVLLLLIGQFNSIKKPIIVLLTIPLGFIGVVFGLLVARSYFGFFAFLGIISLAGIVINNAIVLLDRIQIELDEMGRKPADAVIAAALQRFRPIMLTTATTSLGLIPLWLGGGPMFEPMAIAIIFGLLFATVITLLFVPILYKMLFRVSYKDYQS